jgi:hypothetical protein
MNLELYRGITIRPDQFDELMGSITTNGLKGGEGRWKFQVPADISKAQALARPSIDDPASFDGVWEGPVVAGFCACGSKDGASFYANKHNVDRATGKILPVVITFRASLDRTYIDCRDFLMSTFQGFDRVSDQYVEEQREVLAKLFGVAVLPYFDKCVGTRDQQRRIALGNTVTFDREAILSHLSNNIVMAGRYNTRFKSAFFVSAPIIPRDVVDVEVLNSCATASYVYSLDDFFHGKPVAASIKV